MTTTQRSSSVPVVDDASPTSGRIVEDPSPSIILRSHGINRLTQSNSRKPRKSPLLLGGSSPISKDSRKFTKPSTLAIAHLMGDPPSVYQAANDGGSPEVDEHDCTITSIRIANRNNAVASAEECHETRVSKSSARSRASLPSYRKLCLTAGILVNNESADHQVKSELPTVRPAHKEHIMPTVASHVVQDSTGVIAGYMSAMQHSISAMQVSGPDEPIPSIEATAPGSNDHLQQLHQHRAAVFGEIIKNSITTTLSTKVRASVADEIRLRYARFLMEHEKSPNYAHSVLRTRGKRYWVGMYEFYELSSYYSGRREARETQLVDEIYSHRDRAIAIHFWALHQDRMRYAEICFELSLPLGALLQWILQMCT